MGCEPGLGEIQLHRIHLPHNLSQYSGFHGEHRAFGHTVSERSGIPIVACGTDCHFKIEPPLLALALEVTA